MALGKPPYVYTNTYKLYNVIYAYVYIYIHACMILYLFVRNHQEWSNMLIQPTRIRDNKGVEASRMGLINENLSA